MFTIEFIEREIGNNLLLNSQGKQTAAATQSMWTMSKFYGQDGGYYILSTKQLTHFQ